MSSNLLRTESSVSDNSADLYEGGVPGAADAARCVLNSMQYALQCTF